ncbi:MAG TPA: SDR family NAD(P)-dependent oxidoreductase, partial [Patescibacteria group bacterium]|nr:SDR family NAD(P)-dependent oxidoreductase [Patescibacteria group bacterium]
MLDSMDFKFIKGKKALVTGANGFIGSHLVKRILELGADVSIIVRENSDLWRISSELIHIDVFKYDLTESDKLDSIVEKIKPEYI